MIVTLNTSSASDYDLFLRVKSLPHYRFSGHSAWFPDEYADRLGIDGSTSVDVDYEPSDFLFDYQADIARMAIEKRKFCVFADCGLGKTLIFLEYAMHAAATMPNRKVLIVSPLMVVEQTLSEANRWYGDRLRVEQIRARDLNAWTESSGGSIGITNYDALNSDTKQGNIGCLVLDESSMLKSHYGKWGQVCLKLGRGLQWKLALTGTPAPNDRIEYANHAVFMDAFPNVNAFLARYFVNRGQTQERWMLKPHALKPFYRSLSHWSIFLTDPSVYGWKANSEKLPPINVHVHHVPLTSEQEGIAYETQGDLFAHNVGGIQSRSQLGSLAKGRWKGESVETHKPEFIRNLVDQWPDEQTIIWCIYNHEQDLIDAQFPDAASIRGETDYETRIKLIDEFKGGARRVLITKPKILGFGLNLHMATRQVFSGLQDSYEQYYQAVKRSNRYGATRPLNVHIPVTDIEMPMVQTVLEKADRVQADTEAQEELFRDAYAK